MEDLEDSDTEMEENDVFFQAMCFMCLAGVIFYISCENVLSWLCLCIDR